MGVQHELQILFGYHMQANWQEDRVPFQIIRGNQAKHHDLFGALAGLDQPDMIRGILGPPLSYVIAGPAVDDGIHSEILFSLYKMMDIFFLN